MPAQIASAPPRPYLEIPPHLKASLKRLAAGTHHRNPRGWTGKDAAVVPAEHVTQLVTRNMAKVSPGRDRRFDRVDLTDLGREIAALPARMRAKGAAR